MNRLVDYAANRAPQYGSWTTVHWLEDEPSAAGLVDRLYIRANRALAQGLPVSNEEFLTFEARKDSSNEPLDRACTYGLVGPATKAAWWSAYASQAKMPEGALYSPAHLGILPKAPWSFELEALAQERSVSFKVVFRLYRPGAELIENMSAELLPTIIRKGCQ